MTEEKSGRKENKSAKKSETNSEKKSAENAKGRGKPADVVVQLPAGVTAKKDGDTVMIEIGGKSAHRRFAHPRVFVETKENSVRVFTPSKNRSDKAVVGTWTSLIKNMAAGVTSGYEYKLKVIYTHFPITAKVVGREVHVTNFMGEKGARISKIVGEDTSVEVQKEIIVVHGSDNQTVGQTSANLEKATKLTRVDRRRFPDGIYIFERGMAATAERK